MIEIDKDGNLTTDENGNMIEVSGIIADQQNFISEVRCTQGTFPLLPSFGKNPAVWYLSQSHTDRMDDLVRISKNYLVLKSIEYNEKKKIYEVSA